VSADKVDFLKVSFVCGGLLDGVVDRAEERVAHAGVYKVIGVVAVVADGDLLASHVEVIEIGAVVGVFGLVVGSTFEASVVWVIPGLAFVGLFHCSVRCDYDALHTFAFARYHFTDCSQYTLDGSLFRGEVFAVDSDFAD
jgi:hypothetical protein